uniref:beta strand repeat-containing protein n=2 Tax=Algoriphagus sp. TaxID=1872435 RepID=UPI00404841AE
MKKLFYSIIVTLFFSLSAFAQSEGISFQGLARNAAGEVLVSQKISLRLSILLDTESGAVAYVETRQVTTNPQGIFSLVIGDDTALTKSTIFSSIKWNSAPKFIKVEMDPNGGSSYQSMGTTRLQAVPFAFYAYGVDASNVKGLLPVASGGTGVASISELKTRLGLDNFSNAALDTKVDKVAGKGLSSNDYTTAEKNKLAGITGTNTGDQDLSSYATISQLATKANAADVITSLATKAIVADVIISLDTKANTSEVTTSLAAKENSSNKSNAALGTSTTLYPTQNAVKTYVDAQVASATIPDANATTKGKLQLTGDLGGTAASPTVPGLLLKENVSRKSTATDLGAGSTSDVNYPSQKAVKTYVDAKIAADAPNATSSVPGKVQLAGDLGGSAIAPTVPGLALKAPIDNPAFTGTVTGITKSMVGLANVDNTTDANKPVSTAAQSALDLKAPSASPTFTGTVSGITKAMVDLGNVDNTSDANKPVSTAAQTALNLKEDTSNKSNAALGTSTTLFPTQNAVKTYVDAQILTATIADADASTKGKVQLAGDLAGTGSSAAAPIISDNAITTIKINADAVTSAKIADGAIVNADINTSAAIADTKLATIATSGKVSNSATTATDANTASAIVARDASGNFNAGTITANLTGNVTGNLSGNATNVTGTVAVANGGTGVTTAAANAVFAGPASGASPAAPSFRGLVAADLPSGSTNYINNTTTQQTASFNISGSGTVGTGLTVGAGLTLSALTASGPVFTDADKKLTSAGTLGISQGGTGLTNTPANGQILIGNASGFSLANLTQGTGITITNGSGSISIAASAAAVRPTTDQFSATANQLTFTLTQTPLTNANSKDNVWMFINGVRTNNDAYSVSGTTVTYVPGSNGSYALLAGDRIQFDYMY